MSRIGTKSYFETLDPGGPGIAPHSGTRRHQLIPGLSLCETVLAFGLRPNVEIMATLADFPQHELAGIVMAVISPNGEVRGAVESDGEESEGFARSVAIVDDDPLVRRLLRHGVEQ